MLYQFFVHRSPVLLSSLPLRVDTQGRVIRLDTFSKTIAPGSRLGWFTCNPMFAERLERQGETSTQSPCGVGQSLITKLLLNWKYEGFIRWLRGSFFLSSQSPTYYTWVIVR